MFWVGSLLPSKVKTVQLSHVTCKMLDNIYALQFTDHLHETAADRLWKLTFAFFSVSQLAWKQPWANGRLHFPWQYRLIGYVSELENGVTWNLLLFLLNELKPIHVRAILWAAKMLVQIGVGDAQTETNKKNLPNWLRQSTKLSPSLYFFRPWQIGEWLAPTQ